MSDKVEAAEGASSPPASAVDAANIKKEPPPESIESISTRRYILLSFWAVAIILGLPIWWKTTTVYRAPLPLQPMLDWADGKVSWSG
jgi:phosphatidylinositol glycan class S